MKKLFSKELIIGVTVLITLLVLFFGIDYLKGINVFKATNYYYVNYTNVAGLVQSAPVTINGYKVGQVRDIVYQYDNPGHIMVELSLNKNLRVPKGSKAVLVTDMLGTSSIELHLAAGNVHHEIGDELIGVNSGGLMDDITSNVLPAVTDMIPKVDSLLTAVNYLVSDPALLNSIHRLDNVMYNLESSTSSLDLAMRRVPGIVTTADGTMVNVNRLSANLLTISEDLSTLSARLKDMPVDSIYTNVNAITANLNDITTQLNSPNSSLGLLMRDPALYNNLNNSAAHLDSILIDVKRQPKRYIPPIKIF